MKVYVIPTWHPTPYRPLWANWVLPHIAALRETGAEVYVLQLGLDDEPVPRGADPWKLPPRAVNEQHLLVPVPRAVRRHEYTRFFYASYLRRYTERLRELFRVAVQRWGPPDILHAHGSLPGGYVAAQLGREKRIPVLVQEHYTGFESNARFWWRPGCFVRTMARHIQGFYAVSPGYAARIARTGLVDVTGVLPNPIDTELFRPRCRQRSGDSFHLVTAGDMSPRKGTDVLLEALRRLPGSLDWSLTLFGNTAGRSRYARWLDDPRLAPRVSLPGKVSQAQLAGAYAAGDVYVVSSRIETANVSMLQAMACGASVVTTRCGAPETLLDDSVSISVKPDSPTEMAEAIARVATRRTRFDRRRQREFVVERYGKRAVAEKIIKAYGTVMGRTVL